MLTALSGCKILRELSKLEDETEAQLSMEELAQRFENLAHGEWMGNCNVSVTLLQTVFVCIIYSVLKGIFRN